MSIRHTCTTVAAVAALWTAAGPGVRIAAAQSGHSKMAVMAVGCVQSERQYRRDHESTKFAGTGIGLNDEYVLIDAVVGGPSMAVTPVSEQETNNCIAARGTGQAYELKGSAERGLSSFLGRRVVIHGMLLHARHDAGPVGTSGAITPAPTSGGFDPLGHDLEIREIEVESANLAPIAVPVKHEAAIAPAPEPPAEAPTVAAAAPEPQAPPETPAPAPAPSLPKTASYLPEIGLIGLASLTFGIVAMLFDRRRTRA